MALDTSIGGTSSDSYATVAEFEAYALAHFEIDITGDTTAAKEANLLRAATYIDKTYQWVGYLTDTAQSLDWPRIVSHYVDGRTIASDAIPATIKNAQIELAWIERAGTDLFETITTGGVKKSKVKAAVVETDTEYQTGQIAPIYPGIEAMLAPFITGTVKAGGVRMAQLVRG